MGNRDSVRDGLAQAQLAIANALGVSITLTSGATTVTLQASLQPVDRVLGEMLGVTTSDEAQTFVIPRQTSFPLAYGIQPNLDYITYDSKDWQVRQVSAIDHYESGWRVDCVHSKGATLGTV